MLIEQTNPLLLQQVMISSFGPYCAEQQQEDADHYKLLLSPLGSDAGDTGAATTEGAECCDDDECVTPLRLDDCCWRLASSACQELFFRLITTTTKASSSPPPDDETRLP